MCLQVFVASEEPLPILEYDPSWPVFRTQAPREGTGPVLRLFSKPYVYDLDSIDGCACGFRYGSDDLTILSYQAVPAAVKDAEVADYEARRESVRRLQEYLRSAAQIGTVEIYSCWIGDEMAEPETRLDVALDHFGGECFTFVEKQFLTVSRTAVE